MNLGCRQTVQGLADMTTYIDLSFFFLYLNHFKDRITECYNLMIVSEA